MPLLSIIIPCYNSADSLDKTLLSLTQQVERNFQIIAVDHGSNDQTQAVVERYQSTLALAYYKIPRQHFTSGEPRDFGAKKADAPFLAFLDAGIIVPSFYTQAHIAFHQKNPHHVGIGFQHGQRSDLAGARWIELLQTISIDKAGELVSGNPDLSDIRTVDPVKDLGRFIWYFGWSANLSMPTEAYKAVGGFDLDFEGWGFEDCALCYMLMKHGLQFAFVENGWGIDLPHKRSSWQNRKEQLHFNWRHFYRKQKDLDLEALRYAEMGQATLITFRYLQSLGRTYTDLPALPQSVLEQVTHPSLLIGGTPQDADNFSYIALANETVISTDTLWSCSGILIPLADHSLETVVVSDMWKWLNRSFIVDLALTPPDPTILAGVKSEIPARVSLLECMIAEIKRTARQALFVNSSSFVDISERSHASTTILADLCHQYGLPFQIIS